MWIALSIAAGLATAVVLAIGFILVTHVEDWSRDLTTNYAATSGDARDERLRTLESTLQPELLARIAINCASQLPRWELADEIRDDNSIQLHFVRTTGLVGYKDDIRVRIEPAGGGSRLSAESQSRIGKGDLGQNPRNLRELLNQIRQDVNRRRD